MCPNSIQLQIYSPSPERGGGVNTESIHFVSLLVYSLIIVLILPDMDQILGSLSLTPLPNGLTLKTENRREKPYLLLSLLKRQKITRAPSTKKANGFLKVLWEEVSIACGENGVNPASRRLPCVFLGNFGEWKTSAKTEAEPRVWLISWEASLV